LVDFGGQLCPHCRFMIRIKHSFVLEKSTVQLDRAAVTPGIKLLLGPVTEMDVRIGTAVLRPTISKQFEQGWSFACPNTI
jgi:hypothetical protein